MLCLLIAVPLVRGFMAEKYERDKRRAIDFYQEALVIVKEGKTRWPNLFIQTPGGITEALADIPYSTFAWLSLQEMNCL